MFNTIDEALLDLKRGKMIVVVDDENRENEGDLVMAADMVDMQSINFMITEGKGLVCMPVSEETASRLNLHPMVNVNTDNNQTAFTVSVDHKDCTTGISAEERALTIKKIVDYSSTDLDFKRPGHIFPLVAKKGGVIKRKGHTEAAVDLAKLAGFSPAGVIVEIINEDGTMARRDDLVTFCQKHDLKMITIDSLVEYQLSKFVEVAADIKLPTKYGDFRMKGYVNKVTGEHHVALIKGDVEGKSNVLTRMHSECLTGDVFGSGRCDCGDQLGRALNEINDNGEGVLVYLRQEGRGIGLINKLKAYDLQDQGFDTVEANVMLGFKPDQRSYEVASAIYRSLGIKSVNLMTNNPEKIEGLKEFGTVVSQRVPIQIDAKETNEFYLKTKKEKMNHMVNY